jgi:hypothetical protein
MKAIIEYDLFNAQDAHAYKCSQKAVEAFYTLETIADDLEVWLANKNTSEECLLDIQRVIIQWNKSNANCVAKGWRKRQIIGIESEHQPWCASLTRILTCMPPKPAPCDCKTQCVEHGECFGGKCIYQQDKGKDYHE